MHCHKKLMYNGVFIPDNIFNGDICAEVIDDDTFIEPDYGLTNYNINQERHLIIKPGKKYRLCSHYVYSLLQGWQFVPTPYNVYDVQRIIPSPPLPSDKTKHAVYECIEVKYFYANNKLEYYDFFYS